MNSGDLQEMLVMALAAKEAGFPRIQIDPVDFIEVADQHNQLLAALIDIAEYFEPISDRPEEEKALAVAQILISRLGGAA